MAFVVLENLHSASLVIAAPVDPVSRILSTLGQDQVEQLLRHHAAQQTRNLLDLWGRAQFALGLSLGICLYFATQKRVVSLVLCAIMLAAQIFQFFAVMPELSFRWREAEFGQNQAVAAGTMQLLVLCQMLLISEGLKLVAGCILASYLFAFRASRRRAGQTRADAEAEIGSGLPTRG
ncbi:MAG TPA: hypothetical protein VMT15_09040 [Bryobacteraceae bacterium]|nr:hypothetical protein [Bryobacteraceae bacterium]